MSYTASEKRRNAWPPAAQAHLKSVAQRLAGRGRTAYMGMVDAASTKVRLKIRESGLQPDPLFFVLSGHPRVSAAVRIVSLDQRQPGSSPTISKSGPALGEPRLREDHGTAARVSRTAAPVLQDLGFRIVRVKISAGAPSTLQVMVERPDGTLTIDDCETVSKALSPVLDLEDPISGAYRLEISSPGIDRPLVRLSDYRRALGHEARVELAVPMDGRKRFKGVIREVEAGRLTLEHLDAKPGAISRVDLSMADIGEARLVLTEALIRQSLNGQASADAGEADGSEPTRRYVHRTKPQGPAGAKAAGAKPALRRSPAGPQTKTT